MCRLLLLVLTVLLAKRVLLPRLLSRRLREVRGLLLSR
jgi:hypothetical protein